MRADDDRPLRRDQQGVAVGLRARDMIGSRAAAGAGTVFDENALAQKRAERLLQKAGDRIGSATRRITDDEGDRLIRKGRRALRMRRRDPLLQRTRQGQAREKSRDFIPKHAFLPYW